MIIRDMLNRLLITCFMGCMAFLDVQAQGKAFRIYGEVTTVANKQVCGYVTWTRKMYWTDIFSASKVENPYVHYLEDADEPRSHQGTSVPLGTHAFACRFGNIKYIRVMGRERIELGIKDGNAIELERGNSGGIGDNISVETRQGIVSVPWDHISEILFSGAPDTMPEPKDTPITGIVETPYGVYKGIVQWDLDENSLSDLLDGSTETSDVSVAFKNIGSIQSRGSSCEVVLNSGRTIRMWGENDVNETNRGIAVNMSSVGQVIVYWQDFKSFKAVPMEQVRGLTYDDFTLPERIHGKVETRNGRSLEGVLAYDLDEAMDCELLDGQNGNLAYRIPFKYIRTIEPKNYKYTWIQLVNGGELVLGENSDVTSSNDGILIFRGKEGVVHVRWRDIKRISLWTKAGGK